MILQRLHDVTIPKRGIPKIESFHILAYNSCLNIVNDMCYKFHGYMFIGFCELKLVFLAPPTPNHDPDVNIRMSEATGAANST